MKLRCTGRLMSVAAMLLAILGPVRAAEQTRGTVAQASLAEWRALRKAQPFQTQMIAVSPADAAVRTLIVTEPPDDLSWAALNDAVGVFTTGCVTAQWQLMAGGSVTDVVCTLKRNPGGGFGERLAMLQRVVYGTDLGAAIVSLPAPPRKMGQHSLDLQFAAADLHQWLKDAPPFRRNAIGAPASFDQLLANRDTGVFQNGALVVWTVARKQPIDGLRGEIRRFCLAADHVLGVVGSTDTVAFVGRVRREPVAHLPPLRAETLLLLAGSLERNLAQSYERNDVFAGKGRDGVDRAPILLSPQLVDTEFGNLLNVADQLLKGWSMAGRVRYVDFTYPRPRSYPFGDTPAPFVEESRDSFLFNWNTDGAAYVQTLEGRDYLVPQRTGALPVIYGDESDRPAKMERTAYDYFARSGDTTLARVQQYAFLYQAFRHFEIGARAPDIGTRFAKVQQTTAAQRRRLVAQLLDPAHRDEAEQAVLAYWQGAYRRISTNTSDMRIVGGFVASRSQQAVDLLHTLQAAELKSEGGVSKALVAMLDRRSALRRNADVDRAAIGEAAAVLQANLKEKLAEALINQPNVILHETGLMPAMVKDLTIWDELDQQGRDASRWNHTAYVVRSITNGIAKSGTGGHNIDAPIVRFAEDATIAKGRVSVSQDANGNWVVGHNGANANSLREVSRVIGTNKDKDAKAIEAEVAELLRRTNGQAPVPLTRIVTSSGTAPEFAKPARHEALYATRQLQAGERAQMQELASGDANIIIFEQSDSGYILRRTGSDQALEVNSIVVATDALAEGLVKTAGQGGPVSVLVKGVPNDKAEALLAFMQSSLKRTDKSVVQHMLLTESSATARASRAKFLNAKMAHNGLEVDRVGIRVGEVTDGLYKGYTKVEVPIVVKAPQPFLMRIVLLIKGATARTTETIVTRITAILRAQPREVSPLELAATLKTQLRDDMRKLRIDSMVVRMDSNATDKSHDVLLATTPSDSQPAT